MKSAERRIIQRTRRRKHVRKKMSGSPEKPRLTVFRSHNNIYAQIIDDEAGHTLVSASTRETSVASRLKGLGGNKAAAARVGEALAAKAVEKGITKVVFDRNGYSFHGRVRELAEAARKGGLEF